MSCLTEQNVSDAIDATLAQAGERDRTGEQFRFLAAYTPMQGGRPIPGIVPKHPLTLQGAINYIGGIPAGLPGQGVIAFTHNDAIALTNAFGGPVDLLQPEISRRGITGFFWHYHPLGRPDVHIWFLQR